MYKWCERNFRVRIKIISKAQSPRTSENEARNLTSFPPFSYCEHPSGPRFPALFKSPFLTQLFYSLCCHTHTHTHTRVLPLSLSPISRDYTGTVLPDFFTDHVEDNGSIRAALQDPSSLLGSFPTWLFDCSFCFAFNRTEG